MDKRLTHIEGIVNPSQSPEPRIVVDILDDDDDEDEDA